MNRERSVALIGLAALLGCGLVAGLLIPVVKSLFAVVPLAAFLGAVSLGFAEVLWHRRYGRFGAKREATISMIALGVAATCLGAIRYTVDDTHIQTWWIVLGVAAPTLSVLIWSIFQRITQRGVARVS